MKQVYAHASEANAGIEATMHVEPADHPIVNKESQFFFVFKDPAGTFEISRCDCSIKLLKDDQVIDQESVFPENTSFISLGSKPLFSKVFTEPGNYELELLGSPKDGAIFQPFTLHYNVVVGENPVSGPGHHVSMATEHIGHILIFGVGFVAALGLLIHNYMQNRKQNLNKE